MTPCRSWSKAGTTRVGDAVEQRRHQRASRRDRVTAGRRWRDAQGVADVPVELAKGPRVPEAGQRPIEAAERVPQVAEGGGRPLGLGQGRAGQEGDQPQRVALAGRALDLADVAPVEQRDDPRQRQPRLDPPRRAAAAPSGTPSRVAGSAALTILSTNSPAVGRDPEVLVALAVERRQGAVAAEVPPQQRPGDVGANAGRGWWMRPPVEGGPPVAPGGCGASTRASRRPALYSAPMKG